MTVVEVVPISRGVFRDQLTYYTNQPVVPGAIVATNVRRKIVRALVIGQRDLAEVKASVKNADYPLQKISAIRAERFFLPELLSAAERVSHFSLVPLSQVLKAVVPQAVLENIGNASLVPSKTLGSKSNDFLEEKLVLQQPPEERLSFYRGLIRSEFAKKHSIWFLAPSANQAEKLADKLHRGIEERTFVIHGSLTNRELLRRWSRAVKEDQPILIITTALGLSLPRADWGVMVVEEEGATAYKASHRPFLDGRRLAETIATTAGRTILLGDTVFRPETMSRVERGDFMPASPIKQRLLAAAESIVVDYAKPDEVSRFLSEPVRELLTRASEQTERVFIFTARRGLNPLVVCKDCGHLITCRRCRGPIVLHRRPPGERTEAEPNMLVCHRCHETREVDRRCLYCSGWRLTALGAGIEQIREEIERLFPQLPIYQLDSDRVKSRAQAERIKNRWLAHHGVLLGTELAFGLVDEPIDETAAVAIDSLLSLPDFRIGQKIFQHLIQLRALALKRFIIQTREPENPIYLNVKRGNLTDFWRQEMEARRQFNYPPFQTLIKITRRGEEGKVESDMRKLETLLADYEVEFFEAFTPVVGGRYISHALLRLPIGIWPDQKLAERLKKLPPTFEIDVEPESIL